MPHGNILWFFYFYKNWLKNWKTKLFTQPLINYYCLLEYGLYSLRVFVFLPLTCFFIMRYWDL